MTTRFINPPTISKPPGYTHVVETTGLTGEQIQGSSKSLDEVRNLEKKLGSMRSKEVKSGVPKEANQWSAYPQTDLSSPTKVEK